MTVNPPISGANKGPVKTATQKPTMPIVHISGLSISRQTAPESVNEQAPKNPAKKRHMKIACRSFDTAVTKENTLNPNILRVNETRRPFTSEKGAQTRGPVANPRMYSDTPSVTTSRDSPYKPDIVGIVVEKILLVYESTIVAKLTMTKV